MTLLNRIFAKPAAPDRLERLYTAIVGAGRDPAWYRQGQVPDTLDGRFDMLAAVLALVLLRLEEAGETARTVRLTEAFIADMDGTVRQLGIGDLMVGKHVGRMMSALGGRLSAFRAAGTNALDAVVARNIFHDSPPSADALAYVAGRLERFRDSLAATPARSLLAGEVPSL